jgi:hypothetical protein
MLFTPVKAAAALMQLSSLLNQPPLARVPFGRSAWVMHPQPAALLTLHTPHARIDASCTHETSEA